MTSSQPSSGERSARSLRNPGGSWPQLSTSPAPQREPGPGTAARPLLPRPTAAVSQDHTDPLPERLLGDARSATGAGDRAQIPVPTATTEDLQNRGDGARVRAGREGIGDEERARHLVTPLPEDIEAHLLGDGRGTQDGIVERAVAHGFEAGFGTPLGAEAELQRGAERVGEARLAGTLAEARVQHEEGLRANGPSRGELRAGETGGGITRTDLDVLWRDCENRHHRRLPPAPN